MLDGDQEHIERDKGRFKNQSAIDTAIRKALRENDPRIKEAAQAIIDEDYDTYTRVANEIIGEGHFSEADIVAAIRAEVNAMTDDEEETAAEDKEVSIYEMDHFYSAAVGGDIVMAHAIREDIIQTKVANGKTMTEAEQSFNSGFQSRVREKYESGELSDSVAIRLLVDYGGKTEAEAKSKVRYWNFEQEYPEYDLSESAVAKYYEYAAPAGISVATYHNYKVKTSGIEGDKDKNGNTISGSKKKKIMAVINSLPISKAQKDALYFAEGWAKSELNEAPWR
jgi:hypothetical protein